MDFRRIPFQFSTTDPLKRQEELQRRFGLPANKSNMYIDLANSGAMGTRPDRTSALNSPRLQHRVPIFVEGQSEPTKPSMDGQNVDAGWKPHVRVIPIEIEGEDNTSKRHRWLSGSSEPIKERTSGRSIPVETSKHPVRDQLPLSPKAPRVCNIPIKIEGSDHVIQPKTPVQNQKVKTSESKNPRVKLNGCSASKVTNVNVQKEIPKATEKESPEQVTLRKIQNIEEKLKGYHADVEKFSGTNREKQYRYLDEMLTRCMLELDEIDTMRLDTIRLARKAAVKKVQTSIDLLELKVTKEEKKWNKVSKEPMEVESSADQSSENTEDADMKVEGAVPTDINMDDQGNVEPKADNVEMTRTLPKQINEKVENILIMETEDAVLKPDEKETISDVDDSSNDTIVTDEKMISSPIQITEVGDEIAASETEPVVEEPSSNSRDGNTVDMDLDNCDCESDSKLPEPSYVEICEVSNDSVTSPSKSEVETIGHSNQNVEMDMTDIPVVTEQTVLSCDNSQIASGTNGC